MKIVFIGGRDVHILGGIENYMYNLTRELAAAGVECIVWCESDRNEVETLDHLKIIRHKGPKSNLLCKPWCGFKATVRTLLTEKGVSLIHYNAWPPSLSSWIPRLFGVPSLMEGHGLEWKRSKYSAGKKKILKFMEGLTARTNRNLIMCSEDQVKYFKREYGRDSVCIPCAVNLPDLKVADESDILQKYGLSAGKYFLFLGRLVQDKNPDYLIEAFIQARLNVENEQNGWKLVIAGSNDAMPEYVGKLKAMASGHDDIIFTGAVYKEDKARLLRDAYCFCLPSTIEGLSIVMLEAAAFKLPVIASNIDANREFLQEDAVFVEPKDSQGLSEAMLYAVSNPGILENLGKKNCHKILDKYTWDKVALKYLEYVSNLGIR